MVKSYKTKPCEIEAIQWTGDNGLELVEFAEGDLILVDGVPQIETLEGTMFASMGDYIIRGLKGEYYPCKPDVFVKKYEEIED